MKRAVRVSFFGSDGFSAAVLGGFLSNPHISKVRVFTTGVNSQSRKHEIMAFCKDKQIGRGLLSQSVQFL